MARVWSPLLWSATLGLGVALGMVVGRVTPPLAAQAEGPPPKAVESAEADRGTPADEDALYREINRRYEQFRPIDRACELVARTVSPAVVHIVARKLEQRDDGQMARLEETGSGVIVRAEGAPGLYILTNNHVVEHARAGDVDIFLNDGRALRPDRIWTDAKADIAVIKLGRDDLPAARLGNSDDAAVGTWVLALGSPFGLTHSVSQGIISGRERYEQELEFDGVEHQEFLQTDAAINPGNSGGPLVNLKGEVIGINTAIASSGGGSEGVGFSIPINLARWAMAQLVVTGRVSRGAMGVRLQELSHQRAQELGLERPRGARILSVQEESPASKAGLVVGDVVLKFNGNDVIDFNHLINLVAMTPIGQTADLVYWRDRQAHTAHVAIADRDQIIAQSAPELDRPDGNGPLRRPTRPAPVAAATDLGIDLVTIDGGPVARAFGLTKDQRGVLVSRVDPNSPLAAHLRVRDIIVTLAGHPVRNADEVFQALARGDRQPLEIGLQRAVDGALKAITIRIP